MLSYADSFGGACTAGESSCGKMLHFLLSQGRIVVNVTCYYSHHYTTVLHSARIEDMYPALLN